MPKKVLPEEFKKRCLDTFKNYDYSKTLFTSNSKQVVKYFCSKHGEQKQRLDTHLKYGCPCCAKEKKFQKNKKDFFQKAKEIHNDKYDYSKVNYTNAKTKVEIICPEHGSFSQTPDSHLQKQGCPICGEKKQKTARLKDVNQFIEEAKKIHDNKYDYSKVNYINANIKVEIICPTHGAFLQIPNNHLQKQGCPECGKEAKVKAKLKSTNQFIKEAKEIHDNKYDYSKSVYINAKKPIEIICPIHGSFFQTPDGHINGHGCPTCGRKRLTLRLTKLEILQRAKEIHGDKYSYVKSKLDSVKSVNDKIEIICPIHGAFFQQVRNHIRGDGCPKCKESHGERKIRNWLESKNIEYIYQKKFEDLGRLSYDFFIPSKNLLIEFQGEQHYKPIETFGGIEKFKKQRENDYKKKEYAKKNKIMLLEIPYWEKDLESLLETKYPKALEELEK